MILDKPQPTILNFDVEAIAAPPELDPIPTPDPAPEPIPTPDLVPELDPVPAPS